MSSKALNVGDGIRPWGAADGGLVDEDDVVEVLRADERAEEGGGLGRGGVWFAVQRLHERAVEDLMDERGLAAAADAGDAAEEVEGDVYVDAAQVVQANAGELEEFAAGLAAVARDGDGETAGEIFSGDGLRVGGDFGDRARGEDVAAEFARAGAEVEEVVGGADDGGIVLDDQDGVAEVRAGSGGCG